jgi:Fic family protein
VFDSWRDIPLDENHIKQLHGILLKFSDRDEHHRGSYKTIANNVEAFDSKAGVWVSFLKPHAVRYPTADAGTGGMDQPRARRHKSPSLLVVAVFIVRYLAIHPFQDGNGRLARVLTNLLLLRTGYTYVPYSSLERVIEESREQYYRGLRSAQGTLDRDESHLMDWLRYFLLCLIEQKNSLAEKIKREKLMSSLSALDEQLLQLARQHGRLTLTSALKTTQANRNTLKLHFKQLVQTAGCSFWVVVEFVV